MIDRQIHTIVERSLSFTDRCVADFGFVALERMVLMDILILEQV